MTEKDLLKNILTDIKVEISDAYDKNFERKGFFTTPWKERAHPYKRGTLMAVSGDLRRSIRSEIITNGVRFSSSLPYAAIHNNGGEITVTKKMKGYAWFRYYQAAGAITTTKQGKTSNTQRNRALSAEAEGWKWMALMKVGDKIKIPQRQFIGDHPNLKPVITGLIERNFEQYTKELTQSIKSKIKQ